MMKALTVKQPWASFIVGGVKDVENRTWRTNYRGRIYIHASSCKMQLFWFDNNLKIKDYYEELSMHVGKSMFDIRYDLNEKIMPYYGAIIGSVDIIDCVQNDTSIWAEEGVWNWKLANPILFTKPILNVKGKLSLWNYEELDETQGL